ncbi:CRISPR-associated endonuclease Cas1 [Methylococcus mesophilus]|uniref:CRISPR-associated endonuclease Cas1 n=1 Tax=Methylococcus mesophilus TaxID=2993564 RepID=UPI00224AF622|nr:CRISPR-associated endonuclease Cas1 [Methylococcus mesophilus]UZR29636.1 CRISPR-associated endonuclease Cas1 [Methylococcus mesophilus]
MKPLYLYGTGIQVTVDGTALRISQPEHAARWYPLVRLSRVVSTRSVEWSLPALLLCVEAGITVTFLGTDGTVAMRCLGARPSAHDRFAQRLAEFLQHPDRDSLYADWLNSVERSAVRAQLRRAGLDPAPDLTATELRRLFLHSAREMGGYAAYRAIGAHLRNLLDAYVTQTQHDLGVDLGLCASLGFDPVAGWVRLLQWEFELPCAAWLESRLRRNRIAEAPEPGEILAWFEQRRERLDWLSHSITRRMHRWLIEMN